MGSEKSPDDGVHVEDIKLALRGHVRDGYKVQSSELWRCSKRPCGVFLLTDKLIFPFSVSQNIDRIVYCVTRGQAASICAWKKQNEVPLWKNFAVVPKSLHRVPLSNLFLLLNDCCLAFKVLFARKVDFKSHSCLIKYTDTAGLQEGSAAIQELRVTLQNYFCLTLRNFKHIYTSKPIVHLTVFHCFLQINPKRKMQTGDPSYNPSPTLDDKVHVLVSVIPAGSVTLLSEEVWKKMREVRLAARDMGKTRHHNCFTLCGVMMTSWALWIEIPAK